MSSSNPSNEHTSSKRTKRTLSCSAQIFFSTQPKSRGRRVDVTSKNRYGVGWLNSWRKKVRPSLLQSQVEEKKAESLKSGPLETPTGTLTAPLIENVPSRGRTSIDSERNMTYMASIEEQSCEDSAGESSISVKNRKASLICGCFDHLP